MCQLGGRGNSTDISRRICGNQSLAIWRSSRVLGARYGHAFGSHCLAPLWRWAHSSLRIACLRHIRPGKTRARAAEFFLHQKSLGERSRLETDPMSKKKIQSLLNYLFLTWSLRGPSAQIESNQNSWGIPSAKSERRFRDFEPHCIFPVSQRAWTFDGSTGAGLSFSPS